MLHPTLILLAPAYGLLSLHHGWLGLAVAAGHLVLIVRAGHLRHGEGSGSGTDGVPPVGGAVASH